MSEVTATGQDHHQPILIGGFDDVLVSNRAAALNDSGYSGFSRVKTPSLKGKKASEAMIRGRYSGSDPTSKRDLAIWAVSVGS